MAKPKVSGYHFKITGWMNASHADILTLQSLQRLVDDAVKQLQGGGAAVERDIWPDRRSAE